MTQKEIALAYARQGIRVFPCNPNKSPISSNGFNGASTDAQKVEQWWSKHPSAMVGAPNDQFIILDIDDYDDTEPLKVLSSTWMDLLHERVIKDDSLKVTTLSGGTHYYFKKNPEHRRRIKVMGNVDILANGGYVILPDQKNYVCTTIDTPWDVDFSTLPEINMEEFDAIAEEKQENIQAYKVTKMSLSPDKEKKRASQNKKPKLDNTPDEVMAEVARDVQENNIPVTLSRLDFNTGAIAFTINEGIYKRSERDDIIKVDPAYDLSDEFPMRIGAGGMTNDHLMMLFHNISVQKKMAKYMKVPIPELGETKSFNSMFVGHADIHASMGSRWDREGNHLLIKDFSNFYGDRNEQTDYNLVRMYMSGVYNNNVPRMNGPEWTVWCMRLMVESGVLAIDHLKKSFARDSSKFTIKQKAVADSFILLDAIKSMYKGYCGATTFAIKFGTAWSGIAPATVSSTRKMLMEKGFIKKEGVYDCSGGKRADGFFNTGLFSVIDKEKNEQTPDTSVSKSTKKPNKTKSNDENSNRGANEMRLNEAVEVITSDQADKKAKEMDNRYPDLGTYVSLLVDEKDQKKIRHFVEDIGLIGTAPDSSVMGVPVLVSADYEVLEISQEKTYFMDKFVLDLSEGDDGSTLLVAYGVSPAIEELIEDLAEDHDSVIEEEDSLSLVVSNDVENPESLDLDKLTIQFNEYIGGKLSFSHIDLRYMDEDSIINVMNGRLPIDGD